MSETMEEPVEYPWQGGTVRCDVGLARRIERALEAFLFPDLDDDEDWPSGPTGLPFCGCDTCVRRETIAIVMAMTFQGVGDGLAELQGPRTP